MSHPITCPQCQHHFDIDAVLSDQFDAKYRAQYAQREKDLKFREQTLTMQQSQHEVIITQKVQARERELKDQLRKQLENEMAARQQVMETELATKSRKISELLRTETDLRRKQRELEEAQAGIETQIERRLATERKILQAQLATEAKQKAQFLIQEKDLLIDQLNKRVQDMQQKINQGSMQVQGEVQEILLEQLLRDTYRLDHIEEIRKGELGADVAQVVRNHFGKLCGTILYESKRTKHFSEEWVNKLRQDMHQRNAFIGVLVTATMPKGVEGIDHRCDDNIFICTMADIKVLSIALRAQLVQVEEVQVIQANQGDKMKLLYNYLTGPEFKNQLVTIREVFGQMRRNLDAEKKRSLTIFSKREKQLDTILHCLAGVVGSINGIAGLTLTEFDDYEVLVEDHQLMESE
ncbi:DUF2130 domain-containing protein [Spirosoma harenae]